MQYAVKPARPYSDDLITNPRKTGGGSPLNGSGSHTPGQEAANGGDDGPHHAEVISNSDDNVHGHHHRHGL